MNFVVIWSRRYHDNTVLVRTDKVTYGGYLYIAFAVDRQMQGQYYRVDCNRVKSECERASNGRIECFVIPVGMLEVMGGEIPENMKTEIAYQQREYARRTNFPRKGV